MENNNPLDELLIEYLVSDIAADEKEFVEKWINASDENHRYFESLRNTWKLSGGEKTLNYVLDQVNVDDKWNQIRKAIAEKGAKTVYINNTIIDKEENHNQSVHRRSLLHRFFVRAAIAASVLLILGMGWKFFFINKEEPAVAQTTEERKDNSAAVVRHEVNTTGKDKRLHLHDGSLIVLGNQSEVTYREPFTDRRDITLIGKAYFKVAKDKTRPFSVITEDISTTALGTEFTITTFKNNNQIIVRLYEGKVVVQPLDKSNNKLKNKVYLLPGQAFLYNRQTVGKVQEFKVKNTSAPEQIMNEEVARDNPSLPENSKSPYFMFNNQPLGEVLDHLAGLYNVKIVYDKKDVENLYHIGKYNITDSIGAILKRITSLNNLTISTQDNAYIISK